MRRFITFLVLIMVFSLIGPYFAEAKENTIDSSQLDIGNEDPNSPVNQPDEETSSEKETGEMDLKEPIKNEDEVSKDQSNSLDSGNTTSESTKDVLDQVDESNVEEIEKEFSEVEQMPSEEIVDEQKETVENQNIKQRIKRIYY